MSYSISKVAVLTTATLFGAYVMYMMVSYLTDVWGLTFTHASGILNVFWGSSLILPFALQLLGDSFLGNFWIITISHLAYTAGLGLLALSTPPALSSVTGTCKEYKPECVGEVQKILFYTALPLIVIGISSHIAPTMLLFLGEQDERRGKPTPNNWSTLAMFLVPLAGFVAILFVKPWAVRFGVPAICTFIATVLFLSGCYSYERVGPQGSPLTAFFKVLFASTLNIFHKPNSSDLYEIQDPENHDPNNFLKHTEDLRCLDKAAIKLPNQSVERQSWRLCSITQVEQTKLLVRVLPIGLTLIIPGLVASIGTTYFLEQADQMNRKLGHIKVPSLFLMFFFEFIKKCYENYCKNSPRIGIAASMVFATSSCIIAAVIEKKRLNVAVDEGLVDSENRVSMSMFLLLPQFFLLGLADGISTFSIHEGLLKKGFPNYMSKYMLLLAKAILGIGTASGVLSVYLVGKISERGGRRNWFQSSLNKSRLDNYYWTLAGISAVNFAVYALVAIFYNPPTGDEMTEDSDYEDGARCRPVALLLTIPIALASLVISVAGMAVWIVGMMLTCICPCFICIPMIVGPAMVLIKLPLFAVAWATSKIPF